MQTSCKYAFQSFESVFKKQSMQQIPNVILETASNVSLPCVAKYVIIPIYKSCSNWLLCNSSDPEVDYCYLQLHIKHTNILQHNQKAMHNS